MEKPKTWEDYVTLKNNVNARELEKNLRKVDGDKPSWYAAHHIIAWDDVRATRLRNLLADPGVNIDINDAVNGVYLPQRESARLPGDLSIRHPKIHTDDYYFNLEQELLPLQGNKLGIENKLKNIKNMIQLGQFPH